MYILDNVKDVLKAVVSIARASVSGTVINIAEIASDYTYPVCDSWNEPGESLAITGIEDVITSAELEEEPTEDKQ